ncbi:hypothetical protein KKC63_00850 [Patescibacteria group bacterium]|nr:hypothetical protein [Patescibacteria group bacterium]MBU4023048.1 hypothetical protein [Patescibacteria group bacterium]MBU4078220.1 hypothetical protein [Patescibacteria group bacterium]
MDKDFGELIEYLDKKFNKLEEDIKNLQTGQFKLETGQGNMQSDIKDLQTGQGNMQSDIKDLQTGQSKLQIAVLDNSSKIDSIEEKMATKVEVNKLIDAVDAYMKQGEDYRQEVVMLGNQVNRHEKWIQKIAEKLDFKLDY